MLAVGDAAPDFDLLGTDGQGSGAYRLSAAASLAPVVLAFVPAEFDPASRRLFTALRDTDWGALSDRVAVFGIAPGSIERHRHLVSDLSLPFPMLVDDPGVDAQFGVQNPDGTTHRSVFLVDDRCRVVATWTDDPDRDPGTPPALDPILDALADC